MALESKMKCILISSFGKYSSILSSATVARSMSKKGYMVLGLVLINREKITQLGCESRQFAEEVHQHIKIAKKYVNTWSINHSAYQQRIVKS